LPYIDNNYSGRYCYGESIPCVFAAVYRRNEAVLELAAEPAFKTCCYYD